MTEKEMLMDWIHRVETPIKNEKYSLDKRLTGLVTELFFEHHLPIPNATSSPVTLSFGWAYGYTNFSRTQRRWFKISEGNQNSKVVGCELVRQLLSQTYSDQPDRFFLLQPEVDLSTPLPSIIWNVGEITLAPDHRLKHWRTEDAVRLEDELRDRTNTELRLRRELQPIGTISSWLSHRSLHDLQRLFSTRCLMNFSGLYLTDIDAVAVTDDDGLEFMEFKRKDPADGLKYTPASIEDASAKILEYMARIESPESRGKNLLHELQHDERWKRHSISSFGLDGSHVRTLRLCISAGIRYRYIIWHSSVKELTCLLSPDFRPLADIDLQTRYMTGNCFTGLSFTKGNDSGKYNKNTRFQAMTPVTAFTSTSISRHAIAGAERSCS
tara:strand:- start:3916 stop:5064 length:1149 start_codon:yes stop_codon:yes gene_type:complete